MDNIIKKIIKESIIKYLNEENSLNNNFWKWFGGSKIIENGQPMICYHGSPISNIEVFDISKIGYNKGNYGHYGYGIYFSTDIREANVYGNNIYKCYIKMSNPFVGNENQILELKKIGVQGIDDLVILSIDFESLKNEFKRINDKLSYNFFKNVQEQGEEYAWNDIRNKVGDQPNSIQIYNKLNNISDIMYYTTLNKNVHGVSDYVLDELKKLGIKPKLNKGFEYEQSLHWITDLGNRSKYVTETIKKLGYDGVFYGSEIVVFEPNQIKSIDNDGSWDINDNNIYS